MHLVETVTVGDMRTRVSGAGFPLVLIHGFTTTAEFWREQVGPFSRAFRVIRPNLPGHGVSPSPRGRAYTIDAFVGDVEVVFRQFGIEKAFLVGLSMGGTIAQRFALRHPDLLRGLVLVGATPHGLGGDVKAENVLKAIEAKGVEKASQDVIERSFAASASHEVLEFAKREVIQTPEFVARAAIASLNESDTRSLLAKIQPPTLVVVGREDVITPPGESRTLAAGIPRAELHVVDGAGHFPMLEQPAAFNSALETFLQRCST